VGDVKHPLVDAILLTDSSEVLAAKFDKKVTGLLRLRNEFVFL